MSTSNGKSAGPKTGAPAALQDLEIWFAKTQFDHKVRGKLYEKMASLLKNGVPMMQALQTIYKRASFDGKKPGQPLAVVLSSIMKAVGNGVSFSAALKPWVPVAEAMLLSAGERSGKLEAAMKSAVEVMNAGVKMKAVVQGAVKYPLVLMTACLAVMYLFGTKIIPEFARVSEPDSWTGTAAAMYIMSGLVQVWTIPIVSGVLLLIVALAVSMPRFTGSLRVHLDAYAPWSIYRLSVGAGFMMAFTALIKAGVPTEKALIELGKTASPYLKQRIDGAVMGLRSGLNFGEALDRAGHGFPDREMIDDIIVYASLANFDENLDRLAAEWLDKGVQGVSAKADAMKNMATAMMAGVIAFLVSGMLAIQQTIGQAVQNVH